MPNSQLSPEQQAILEGAVRKDVSGWIHLHIEGAPHTRGFQHGFLLAPEIAEALRVIRYLIEWDTGDCFSVFEDAALNMFPKWIPDEYKQEMQGIADGASAAGVDVSYNDILAWNAYPELICNWWPNYHGTMPLKKREQPGRPSMLRRGHHCSAFVSTGSFSEHGAVVMAHTTWQLYAASDSYNLILDIKPDNGAAIIMQSVPGYIDSSCDFLISSNGLMITETTMTGYSAFDPTGSPEFMRSRQATQYATSIKDWTKIMLDNNNGGYGNTWLLGDINSGEIARFDLGLKFSGLERTKDGFYGGYNAAENLKVRKQECVNTGYSNIKSNGSRRVRWNQLQEEHRGTINTQLAQQMIADHYDVYLKQADNPCSRTICGHMELDRESYGGGSQPYIPWGSADGKVADSDMARNMSLQARWGHACGREFNAEEFLAKHTQFDWLNGYMKSRPSQPWALFPVKGEE